MNKKYLFMILIILILVVGASLLLIKINSPTGAVVTEKHYILAQSMAPGSTPTIIADKKGFFAKEGLDIEVKPFTSGKLAFDALLGGSADFATVAETPLVYASLNGQEFYIIATMTYSNSNTKIIVRKDHGILSPQDLKGKKVATFIGSNAEFFMSEFLTRNGLSTNDVKIVNLRPPEMPTALINGDIDAFFAWEPHVYNAKKELGDNAEIYRGDFYTETFNIVVRKDFAEANPKTIEKFIMALLDSEEFIQNNRDASVKIVADYLTVDSAVLENIWQGFSFKIVLDTFLLDSLNNQAEWAIKNDKVPAESKIPNYTDFVYKSALMRINNEAVTI
ncbi:NrtA/SsuA/CpmA family ABC transporter substrate-binding protein [Candidatus Woesearchaeota archaeon]|nr:NrtA/SsuA/CpmA family ABC transporter substrate-binding protein [Candidatus Woesearchaeota archaeon]